MALHTDKAYPYKEGYSLVVIRDKPNGKIVEVQIFLGSAFIGLADDEDAARTEVDRLIEQKIQKSRPRMRL